MDIVDTRHRLSRHRLGPVSHRRLPRQPPLAGAGISDRSEWPLCGQPGTQSVVSPCEAGAGDSDHSDDQSDHCAHQSDHQSELVRFNRDRAGQLSSVWSVTHRVKDGFQKIHPILLITLIFFIPSLSVSKRDST